MGLYAACAQAVPLFELSPEGLYSSCVQVSLHALPCTGGQVAGPDDKLLREAARQRRSQQAGQQTTAGRRANLFAQPLQGNNGSEGSSRGSSSSGGARGSSSSGRARGSSSSNGGVAGSSSSGEASSGGARGGSSSGGVRASSSSAAAPFMQRAGGAGGRQRRMRVPAPRLRLRSRRGALGGAANAGRLQALSGLTRAERKRRADALMRSKYGPAFKQMDVR